MTWELNESQMLLLQQLHKRYEAEQQKLLHLFAKELIGDGYEDKKLHFDGSKLIEVQDGER